MADEKSTRKFWVSRTLLALFVIGGVWQNNRKWKAKCREKIDQVVNNTFVIFNNYRPANEWRNGLYFTCFDF